MKNTSKLTLTGVMTAAVTVATMAIMIPVPNTGGYIHAGDSMVFLSVLVLGWRYGAFAAGVGSALADLLSGYIIWAPATLIIKTLMAVLMGLAIEKAMKSKKNTMLLFLVVAASWVVFNLTAMLISKMAVPMIIVTSAVPVLLIVITLIIRKRDKVLLPMYHLLGITLAGLWMVFGYFVAGGVMYGSFAASVLSIPMNVIQFGVGFLIAELIWAGINNYHLKSGRIG